MLEHQISLTLGDHIADYDIPAIEADIRAAHGPVSSIDAVPTDEYWEIVQRHDRTAPENKG